MPLTGNRFSWLKSGQVKAVLLDITGVLYDSGVGDGEAIPGSIEAVKRLQQSHLKLRFCSNETHNTRHGLVSRLQRLGFDIIESQVFTPAPATAKLLKDRQLRPHLLVYPNVRPEFSEVPQENPNCVVIGDAAEAFTYEAVNKAFQVLISMEKPTLISMGIGRYYKETDGLKIDVGAYCKALEYACDLKAELVGKPTPAFYHAALEDMDVTPDETIMIGDDINGDIKGSQVLGMRAILVRTGKWRNDWEQHPEITPDEICDNLAEAVDELLRLSYLSRPDS